MATTSQTRKGPVLAVLCVAQFIDVLGITVVVVALPEIGRQLGFDPGQAQWVISAYALFFGGFLVLFGRLADRFGRRRMFMAALLAFVLASAACGLAWSPWSLVAARGAQGLAAAAVVPAALSLLLAEFPAGASRTRALGVWTASAAGGGAFGFAAGGVMTAALGWRSVFLAGVPVGLAALAAARLLLRESQRPSAREPSDILGAAAGTAGLLALILAVSAGSLWSRAAAALAAILLLALFVRVEHSTANPIVPPALVRRRGLAFALALGLLLTATTTPASIFAAEYLQTVRGQTAGAAGFLLMPFSLAVVAGSAAGTHLTRRYGPWRCAAAGVGTVATGMAAGVLVGSPVGLAAVLAALVLGGFGLGGASVAATVAGTQAVSSSEEGITSGLLNTAPQIGTALGTAALGSLAAQVQHAAGATHGLRSGYGAAMLVAVGGVLLAIRAVRAAARDARAPDTGEPGQ